MVKSHPQISVIMAVYNGEKYLNDSINGILNQTFEDLEFIIIDDCSKDGTSQILSNQLDPRIIVITNTKNIGLSASLNIGIHKSKGKYIARNDADDISLPERLAIQFDFMEKNSHIGILGTGYNLIEESGMEISEFIYPTDELEIRWKLLSGPIFPHPTVMMRGSVLRQNNLGYNEKLLATQDYELWIRLMTKTRGTNIPISLINYRQHENSASNSKIDLQESNRLSISIEALKRFSVERNVSSEQSLIFSKLLKGDITKHEIKLNAQFIGSIISNFFKGHKNQYPSYIWKKNQLHPILFTIEKIIFSEFDELDNPENHTYKLLWIIIKINPIQWTLQLICYPNKLYQYLKLGWIILGNKLNIRNKY